MNLPSTPLAEDIAVKINGTDLIQILLNLAVNAFQCAPQPHRVEVGGETLRAPLDLTKFKDGPNDRLLNVESMDNTAPLVKLWVRDNGPGIPAEVLPKIFQPYFTTKGPRQGTGLGLNIVQRLIKEGSGALHCPHATRRRHDLHDLSAGHGFGKIIFDFQNTHTGGDFFAGRTCIAQ